MNFSDGPPQGVRLDRFYGGAFALLQPVRSGFRAGLDALLLAATVPHGACGDALDLGAGTGGVGFAAAIRAPALSVTMVENEAATVALARASAALTENAALARRLSVVETDALTPRHVREAAGLRDGAFDLVLTNPPFYPADYRSSPDPLRRAALSASGPDFLMRWLRVAAALVRPGGRLVAILRPSDLPTVAAAFEKRLGGIAVLPVHTRPGAATRILVGAVQGSRKGLSILPGLVLFDNRSSANAVSRAIAEGRHHIDLFSDPR